MDKKLLPNTLTSSLSFFLKSVVITGWDDPDYVPEAIGWEGEKPKEINLESMNPAR